MKSSKVIVNYIARMWFQIETHIGTFDNIPTEQLLDMAQKRIDYLRSHPQDANEAFDYEDSYTTETSIKVD